MDKIKLAYNKIAPKYKNNNGFIYSKESYMSYKVDPYCHVYYSYSEESNDGVYLFKVSDLDDESIKLSDSIDISQDIWQTYDIPDLLDITFYSFFIDKEFFSVLNSIVSSGISNLDIGKIYINNGVGSIVYAGLNYIIKYSFEVEDTDLSINDFIKFNTIWYLYVMYRDNAVKHSLEVQISPQNNYYIFRNNNIIVKHNNDLVKKNFSDKVLESIDSLTGSNKNIFSKKYFIEQRSAPIYKNALKCFGDDIAVLDAEKYEIITPSNRNIPTLIIGKSKG